MTVTKILTRRMADLITPSDMGENLLKFNKVVLPCGRMPAGYESVEGITISQLGDIIIEHLDVAGLIPDLSGGGGVSQATKIVYLNYTVNPNYTIPLEDIDILRVGNNPTSFRMSEAINMMPDQTKPNFFAAINMQNDKIGFMNMDESNAEVTMGIRLIPENQDMIQNITFSENPTFAWKAENAAYMGKLLPFPKPVLGTVTRSTQQNGNYLFEGSVSNMIAGYDYQIAVSSTLDNNQGYQMSYYGNSLNLTTPSYSSGNIPPNMFPYGIMVLVKDFVGYRNMFVMQS